jgi:hypothetical protein
MVKKGQRNQDTALFAMPGRQNAASQAEDNKQTKHMSGPRPSLSEAIFFRGDVGAYSRQDSTQTALGQRTTLLNLSQRPSL